jgi:hypothetical protein
LLYTVLMVLGVGQVSALPITYYWFSDTELYYDSGSGTFAIDIDDPLGIYFASEVNGGGGDKTGTWTGVKFTAVRSYLPTLTIYGENGSQSYSFMSTTGGGVSRYSTASAEWEYFIQQAARNRITITADPNTGPPTANDVPEGKLPLLLCGMVFAGIFAVRRITAK